MLIHQQAFCPRLIRAAESQMARTGAHDFDEENASHGRTGRLQRLDRLIGQRNGRMVAQRDRAFDVVVDGAGKADDLDTEPFIDRPRAPQAAVTTQDDDRRIVK